MPDFDQNIDEYYDELDDVVEPRRHSHVRRGSWGSAVVVQPGGQALIAELASGDDTDVMLLSVMLSVPIQASGVDPTVAAQATRSCFARINFGAGGYSASLDTDFVNGTVLCVPASFVSVVGFNQNPAGGLALTLGAFCSPGSYAGAAKPIRSLVLDIPAGGSGTFLIPAFASTVRVMRTPSNPLSLSWQDPTGTVAGVDSLAAGVDGQEIIFGGQGVTSLVVTNNGGVSCHVTTVWTLPF